LTVSKAQSTDDGRKRGTRAGRTRSSRLRQSFVAGLVVILPLFITALLLRLVVGWLRSILHGTFSALFRLIAGPDLVATSWFGILETVLMFAVGLPIVLAFILFVGWLARQYVGRRLLKSFEDLVKRIPLVGGVYDAAKQLVTTVFAEGGKSYQNVVLVEYPRKGTWMLGFVTSTSRGEIQMKTAEHVVGVFVPTTPNPTSGFLLYVPQNEIVHLDMSVEDGIKLVISGGVVEPPFHAPDEAPGVTCDPTSSTPPVGPAAAAR
jgi:uncharacterized membrane protein